MIKNSFEKWGKIYPLTRLEVYMANKINKSMGNGVKTTGTYQTQGLYEQAGCPYVQVGVVQNVHCCTSLTLPGEAEICCPEK